MPNVQAYLPVFLPGLKHDWQQIAGVATISESGEINIKLQDKGAAAALVDMKTKGMLVDLSFTYRADHAVPRHIKDKEPGDDGLDQFVPGKA